MKFLTEEEIKNELNYYIYNVNIKYAVLLNGSWGSGKTYFVKNFIEKLEDDYKKDKDTKYKKPLYISLYGLSNVLEIKNKILLSLIKNKKFKKMLPLIDLCAEVGSEFVSSKTFIQNSNRKIDKIIDYFYKIDNSIIFFDDLERCNININTILGYINELVEHKNVKVIIISDENKIGTISYSNNTELKYLVALSNNIKMKDKNENDNFDIKEQNADCNTQFRKDELIKRIKYIFSENDIYNEIKEKLIGKIIYYRADINSVYDEFLNNIIKDEDAKITAINNKNKFITLLEEKEYYNLRTIQFIFQSFNRLVTDTKKIIELENIKDCYLNDLFSYCTLKSIQIKQGKNSYNWEPNQEFGTVYLSNNSENYIYENFVTGFRFVDDYLINSHINKERIEIVLNDYKKKTLNEFKNPDDPLYKLQKWWITPESKLNEIINDLINKIKKNEYDLEIYSKIVNYLSHIEEMDACKPKITEAIKALEKNIKKGIVKGNYNEDSLFDSSVNAFQIYQKNINNIKKLIKQKKESDYDSYINDIFLSDNWGKQFKDYCDENFSEFLENKRFANILDIDQIISNIENKNIEQIYEFWYGLKKIYDFSNLKDYYSDDKDILTKLKNKLYTLKNIDKVKLFAVNKIIAFLDDVIAKL